MRINLEDRRFALHPFLFQILRGDVLATEVTDFDCPEAPISNFDDHLKFHGAEVSAVQAEAAANKPSIQRAVEASPWIRDEEAASWTDDIAAGDEDAALGLIIPLLVNLHYLCPPLHAPRLESIIRRIAIASAAPTSGTSSLDDPEPLGKLIVVTFYGVNGNYRGPGLDKIALFAALPAVRRLHIPYERSYSIDGDFRGWPSDLPLSHATEVYFDRATIVPADARKFARGFAGPCVFWQWWVEHPSNLPEGQPPVEWDHFELGAGGTRTEASKGEAYSGIEPASRKEVMELRYPDFHEEPGDYGNKANEPSIKYPEQMNAMIRGQLFDWKDLVQ